MDHSQHKQQFNKKRKCKDNCWMCFSFLKMNGSELETGFSGAPYWISVELQVEHFRVGVTVQTGRLRPYLHIQSVALTQAAPLPRNSERSKILCQGLVVFVKRGLYELTRQHDRETVSSLPLSVLLFLQKLEFQARRCPLPLFLTASLGTTSSPTGPRSSVTRGTWVTAAPRCPETDRLRCVWGLLFLLQRSSGGDKSKTSDDPVDRRRSSAYRVSSSWLVQNRKVSVR